MAEMLPLRARALTLERGGERLIDGVDLTVESCGITMIMGPNGAGKSLLLRLLHGLIAPSRGELHWGGEPMSAAIRLRQGMVFQKPVLLRRSVAANIDFVLKLRGRADPARRDGLLAEAGLSGRTRQSARSLSGGEQQRLALVRALALDPEILFLDEPTASLDPASVVAFERIVAAVQARGTKIFFVTHDVGQAKRLGGDVVFLHHGGICEHTDAPEFFDCPASPEAQAYLEGRLVL